MAVLKKVTTTAQVPNMFIDVSERAQSSRETINAHAMWYQASPLPRHTSRDQHFRKQLIDAYLVVSGNEQETASNFKHHLWTDRRNAHALYMPCGEIEIPHSLLARTPVSLHFDGDIEELINNVPDTELRKKLNYIFHHPAIQNIGMRSDLVRTLYGLLYSEKSKFPDGEPTPVKSEAMETNIHVDIDTIEGNRRLTNYINGLKQEVEGNSGKENINLKRKIDDLGWQNDSVEAAKMNIRAMHRQVKALRYPVRTESSAKIKIGEQKSFSGRNAVKKTATSKIHFRSPSLKCGFLTIQGENSLIAMKPFHPDVIKVINATYRSLRQGKLSGIEASEPMKMQGENGIAAEASILKLHEINSGIAVAFSEKEELTVNYHLSGPDLLYSLNKVNSTDVKPDATALDEKVLEFYRSDKQLQLLTVTSRKKVRALLEKIDDESLSKQMREQHIDELRITYNQTMTDYFRLCQRIIQLAPRLQDKLNLLKIKLNDDSIKEHDRRSAEWEAHAVIEIYAACRRTVAGYVNRMSYLPQVTTFTDDKIRDDDSAKLNGLWIGLLGTVPEIVRTDSWKGKNLKFEGGNINIDQDGQFRLALTKVFNEIKSMLRPQTTDEYSWL